MSSANKGIVVPNSNGLPTGERLSSRWSFNVANALIEWDWSASPDPRTLGSVRDIPRARAGHSHAPAWAYSVTVGRQLRVESGLEHDLVRELDRQPGVAWLVPQPMRLEWARGSRQRPAEHTPDLLVQAPSGEVTVWDARPPEEQDEDFRTAAARTREACESMGWRYQVFSGLSQQRRMNLLWLGGFRRSMPWYRPALELLRAESRGNCTIADVHRLDGGRGHVLSAMWHGIWTGSIGCDLDVPLTTLAQLDVGSDEKVGQ